MCAEIAVFVLNLSDIIFLRTALHKVVLRFVLERQETSSICVRVIHSAFN